MRSSHSPGRTRGRLPCGNRPLPSIRYARELGNWAPAPRLAAAVAGVVRLIDRVAGETATRGAKQRADRAVAATGDRVAEQAARERADDRAAGVVAAATVVAVVAVIVATVVAAIFAVIAPATIIAAPVVTAVIAALLTVALRLGGDGDQGRGAHCERADGEGEGLEHQTSPIWDLGECAGGGPFDPDDSLMVESD